MEKDRLDGWKVISKYLDRDIRTCQRWEKELGLPVYRINKLSFRSKVFSYKSQIDYWLKGSFKYQNDKKRFHSQKTRIILVFLLTIILVSSFVIFSLFILKKKVVIQPASPQDPNPVQWVLKGKYLAFYDLKDKFLWSVKIDSPANLREYYYEDKINAEKGKWMKSLNRSKVDFSDIDKDGKNEVLCFLKHEDPRDRCIALFDNDSQMIWFKSIEFNQEYEGGRIVNDYVIMQLEFEDIDEDSEEEILALWRHERRFPGIFVIYNKEGNELLKYCHTGHLQFFMTHVIEGNHKEIYLGGTNNLLGGDAILSVLDCRQLKSGLAPPYDIPEDLAGKREDLWIYIPKSLQLASQKYYLRFRHNEFSRIMGAKWISVTEIHAGKNEINVKINYYFDYSLYFSFDSNFNLRYVRPGANLERKYRKLFKEGLINTPIENFIQQCEKDVLFWSGKRWTEKPTKVKNVNEIVN